MQTSLWGFNDRGTCACFALQTFSSCFHLVHVIQSVWSRSQGSAPICSYVLAQTLCNHVCLQMWTILTYITQYNSTFSPWLCFQCVFYASNGCPCSAFCMLGGQPLWRIHGNPLKSRLCVATMHRMTALGMLDWRYASNGATLLVSNFCSTI